MAKVFISSTSKDLQLYRQAAIDACNELGLTPIAMEFFEAMGVGATEGSKRKLDDADVYTGIFAHRYGYIETGYDQAVTEIEFDYAGERKLDRLCFLVDPEHPWPPDAIDYEHYSELKAFKARIERTVIRKQFTTVADFKAKFIQSLVKWKENHPHAASAAAPESAVPVTAKGPMTACPVPALVIGRDGDLDHLKARLGIDPPEAPNPLTVIRGWPGVGKTTLVAALVHSPEVITAFPDGILWASVGENPNQFSELMAWARALDLDVSAINSLEDATSQIRQALLRKQMLLVVDDVWQSDAFSPFQVAGPACSTLVTTRLPEVANEIAPTPSDEYVLKQLDEKASLTLLQHLAPNVLARYPDESRQLVNDLEGLPLALRVAGRLLAAELNLGWDITGLFGAIAEGKQMMDAKAPPDRFDPATGTILTVSHLLKKSTDRLGPEALEAFTFLGAFAPKPATFDLAAMQDVWMVDDPKPMARHLTDRGLLEPIIGTGRFQMHAVLVMHAKQLMNG